MKLRIITLALLTGTSIASAADLPARTYSKAPAYIAPVYNWTGIYIGGHLGASFNSGTSFTPAIAGVPFTESGDDAGFLGGGQIGADYQFAPNWLVGIEGQISGLSNNERTVSNPVAGFFRDKNDWIASVTGRLGYTWGPGLIYAKGGVAFRDNNGLGVFTPAGVPVPFTTDRNDTGYTVGGGFEYLFAPAWSAKVEYQYYNFDNTTIATPLLGTIGSYNSEIHTVKVGLNYRFNWGGPVVAKY